jgi:hypothetical protein
VDLNAQNMESSQRLSQRLVRVERHLEKVRGVEYSLPFGSMKRARVSRKWDMLAREKYEIITNLYAHPDYEDGMRLDEQQTIIE